MDDMEVPEQARLVADAMEPVIHEIVYKKQDYPRPPGFGRELIRRQLVCRSIDQADEQAEKRAKRYAYKADQNICPGVFCLVEFWMPSSGKPRLDGDEYRE